ncbi:CBO0543 family protein [Salinithrix halophila]|uniref:CBO0543 family protein n=1 Tax=Salinithrix halophila TaxID=1485204 RepID=A0ABV8JDQ8_9BACL
MFLIWFVVWWIIGLLYIDWKRWRIGYPTALAGSLGSFFIDTASVSGGFWSYPDPLLSGLWPNILLNFSIYPVGSWIFVQKLPEDRLRQVLWIIGGAIVLLVVEFHLGSQGRMSYHNGWNIGWSALANLFLLSLLVVHYRKAERGHPSYS